MPVSRLDPLPAAFPSAEADRCVKCGLCLPHCPSYRDTQLEGDSPRGRIALMQGLAEGRLALGPRLEQHLDACLGCRACERVCPAGVPYGALIDAGRAQMAAQRPQRLRLTAVMSLLLRHRGSRRLIAGLLWTAQQFGLIALLRALLPPAERSRSARLLSLLPRIERPRTPKLRRAAAVQMRVALFAGCVGEISERGLAEDLSRLLAACGIDASLPARQGCCGAIDQHAGRPAVAARCADANVAAFPGSEIAAILPLATGCAATLRDYGSLATQGGAAFAARLRDPLDFLLEHGAALRFRALPLRVAIHEPCTQTNVIRKGSALRRLLERVPELEIVDLDRTGGCCGAAGSYFVTEPDSADRLLAPKLDAARALAPQIIVSANVGCSLHLAAGLRRAGLSVETLHPLRLLARQLA